MALRDNDARGNVVTFEELSWNGDVTRHTYDYNGDNQLLTDLEDLKKADESNFKRRASTQTTLVNYLATKSIRIETDPDDNNRETNRVTTDNTYEYWDDAKITNIAIKATFPKESRPWEPGTTDIFIDQVNGHVERTHDLVANRWLYYTTDVDGRVIRREEIDGQDSKPRRFNLRAADVQQRKLYFQNYYFFNGREIGTVSTDPDAIQRDYAEALAQKPLKKLDDRKPASSADFDQNYQPIGTNYPSRTASVYTVARDGETLPSIATAIWGDASLWYLLADANGLTNNSGLEKGQRLVIPNKVTNVHNNSQTFRPYDAGQALGNISPTLPSPPPAKEKCGGMAPLILSAIALVVAAITQQWWVYQLGAEWLGAAAAAATGSIVSQSVGVATGLLDKFSWTQVAMEALTAGVGKSGISIDVLGSDILSAMATQAVSNAAVQGIAVATHLQKKFDWKGVAAAGLGAGLGEGMGQLFTSIGLKDPIFRSVFIGIGKAGVKGAVYGKEPNWTMAAAESLVSGVAGIVGGGLDDYLQWGREPASSVPQSSASTRGSGSSSNMQGSDSNGGSSGNGDAVSDDQLSKARSWKVFYDAAARLDRLRAESRAESDEIDSWIAAVNQNDAAKRGQQKLQKKAIAASKGKDAQVRPSADNNLVADAAQATLGMPEFALNLSGGALGIPPTSMPQSPIGVPAAPLLAFVPPALQQKLAEQTTKQASTSAFRAAGRFVASLVLSAGKRSPWALLFVTTGPRTVEWEANGNHFSIVHGENTLTVTNSEGERSYVGGINVGNPHRYTDAQILDFITHKNRGGDAATIDDFVSRGQPQVTPSGEVADSSRYGSIPPEHRERYDRYLNGPSKIKLAPDAWLSKAERIWENNKNGNDFESILRKELGVSIGRGSKPISINGFVPDLPVGKRYGVSDVKNQKEISNSRQLQAFFEYAKSNDLRFNLYISRKTETISAPVLGNVKATGGSILQFDPVDRSFTTIDISKSGPWHRKTQ